VSTNTWLTVGLSVGCGLLLIIVAIVIVRAVLACRRRNTNKPVEQREETRARNDYVGARRPADDFELDDRNYWTIPADSAEMPESSNVYCSARADEPDNEEYTELGEPQPQSPPQPQPQPQPQTQPQPQPQPQTQSTTNDSPYYLSLKDDDE